MKWRTKPIALTLVLHFDGIQRSPDGRHPAVRGSTREVTNRKDGDRPLGEVDRIPRPRLQYVSGYRADLALWAGVPLCANPLLAFRTRLPGGFLGASGNSNTVRGHQWTTTLSSCFRRLPAISCSFGVNSNCCPAVDILAAFMDSSLHEVWQAAYGSPFVPTVGKGSQFLVAFVLLLLGFALSGAFALSTSRSSVRRLQLGAVYSDDTHTDRSLVNLPVLAVPASLALAYVHSRLLHFPILTFT